ncbi:MAG: DUF1194 domain-containing protein [Pseudomonadota bacterium]
MRWLLALLLPLIAVQTVRAQDAPAYDMEVDVELVLAVDVSRSMSPRELEIQRRGYAEALSSDEVIRVIETGMLGRVAIVYIEWAGSFSQRVIVDWTLIDGPEPARAFATKLTSRFDPALRRTSISGGLTFAAGLFADNGYEGLRRVIDVSGDGPNNMGNPVLPVRDAVVAQGIIINGLPLMTREGMGAQWHLDDLDEYYRHCVIGGPMSFVIPVLDWDEFAAAVKRKLVLELAGRAPPAQPRLIRASEEPGYDCLIGEKIWERLRDNWIQP